MVYKKVLFLPKTERKKKIKNKFKKKWKMEKKYSEKIEKKVEFFREKKSKRNPNFFKTKKCEIKIESNTPKDAIWKGPPTTVSWNEHSPVPTPTLIQQGPCASRFLRKIKKILSPRIRGPPVVFLPLSSAWWWRWRRRRYQCWQCVLRRKRKYLMLSAGANRRLEGSNQIRSNTWGVKSNRQIIKYLRGSNQILDKPGQILLERSWKKWIESSEMFQVIKAVVQASFVWFNTILRLRAPSAVSAEASWKHSLRKWVCYSEEKMEKDEVKTFETPHHHPAW